MFQFSPYFYVECEKEVLNETVVYLENKFEKQVFKIEVIGVKYLILYC